MKYLAKKPLSILILALITLTLISCGSDNNQTKPQTPTETNTTKDFTHKVQVIDGYIKNAIVTDGLSNIARYTKDGIYEYEKNIKPELLQRATGGTFTTSNLENKLTFLAEANSTIISPLTTLIHNNKPKKETILKALNLTEKNLDENYIQTNNIYLAKINQILYILEVNELTGKFTTTLKDKQLNLTEISQKAKEIVTKSNSIRKNHIKTFINQVKNLNINTNKFEQTIKIAKEKAQSGIDYIEPTPPVPTPDTTPPSIISSTPEHNATDINLDTNITVTFSESINQSTLNFDNIVLTKKGSPDENVSATLTKTSNSFTLKPDSNLSELSKYELSIKNIKDLNQNKLATTTIIKFKTKDTTPPTVSMTNTTQSITLTFSEKLKTPEQANFILKQDTNEVEFDLNTSKNPIIKLSSKTSFKFDTEYNLTIQNIQDLAENTMTKTNKTFKTPQSKVLRTGQTQCYDSSDNHNEISCDSPKAKGQDGYYESLNLGIKREFTRSSDIVTDKATNLEWRDDTAVSSNSNIRIWGDIATSGTAQHYCDSLNTSGQTGWRLPSIQELSSIVDYSKPSNRWIFSAFTNTATGNYWTNTPYAPNSDYALSVTFNFGYVGVENKTFSIYVRCVRQ